MTFPRHWAGKKGLIRRYLLKAKSKIEKYQALNKQRPEKPDLFTFGQQVVVGVLGGGEQLDQMGVDILFCFRPAYGALGF